jgi:hypothetical protein
MASYENMTEFWVQHARAYPSDDDDHDDDDDDDDADDDGDDWY